MVNPFRCRLPFRSLYPVSLVRSANGFHKEGEAGVTPPGVVACHWVATPARIVCRS